MKYDMSLWYTTIGTPLSGAASLCQRFIAACQRSRNASPRDLYVAAFAPSSSARRERRDVRSEEHTSELQSLTNLVCRLLLEKKKRTRQSENARVNRRSYGRIGQGHAHPRAIDRRSGEHLRIAQECPVHNRRLEAPARALDV